MYPTYHMYPRRGYTRWMTRMMDKCMLSKLARNIPHRIWTPTHPATRLYVRSSNIIYPLHRSCQILRVGSGRFDPYGAVYAHICTPVPPTPHDAQADNMSTSGICDLRVLYSSRTVLYVLRASTGVQPDSPSVGVLRVRNVDRCVIMGGSVNSGERPIS